jgi:hypothetical protein
MRPLAALLVVLITADVGAAKPVAVRYREGASHGFLRLSDSDGTVLAHGELTQWVEGQLIASRLVFNFADGSLYDELVRFSQKGAFRIESYKLEQRGPAFKQTSTVEFDRSGHYRVRLRSADDKEDTHKEGRFEIPADASNGLTSILLKNLPPGASGTAHLLAFTPDPSALEVSMVPEGDDRYWVGSADGKATRYRVQAEVVGVRGVVTTVIGKQPPPFFMWIATGKAPVLVRFRGPLYMDGPEWRIELDAPRWTP